MHIYMHMYALKYSFQNDTFHFGIAIIVNWHISRDVSARIKSYSCPSALAMAFASKFFTKNILMHLLSITMIYMNECKFRNMLIAHQWDLKEINHHDLFGHALLLNVNHIWAWGIFCPTQIIIRFVWVR